MDFIGKVCPYCKAEFKEGDDVVICSACEMPHHKECWVENQGCTTFGCTGTIMGVNNQLQHTSETFNANYGYQKANYSPHDEANIEEDIRTFVGINQEYFLEKFQKFNGIDSNASWNWASAFLGGFWYAYRKMYKIQFLYYVMYFLTVIGVGLLSVIMIAPFGHTSSTPSMLILSLPLLIFILPFLFSGMFGNYLYKRHVDKHVQVARSMEDYAKQNYIIKHGGVSNGAVWVIIGIRVLFFVISVAGRNLN